MAYGYNMIIGQIMPWTMSEYNGYHNIPAGYMLCDGRELLINEHKELFNVIYNTYGGDGKTNFCLPDLRGRIAVGRHTESHPGEYGWGETGGLDYITINKENMASHSHMAKLKATTLSGNATSPVGNILASVNKSRWYRKADSPDKEMHIKQVETGDEGNVETGRLENRMPSLVLKYIIKVK